MITEKLRMLIRERDMTQSDFAEMLGIKISSMSLYLNGKRQISTELLRKMSDALSVSADYLLDTQYFRSGRTLNRK